MQVDFSIAGGLKAKKPKLAKANKIVRFDSINSTVSAKNRSISVVPRVVVIRQPVSLNEIPSATTKKFSFKDEDTKKGRT
mmetsp:Transcript_76782/g.106637  ORF Transcript_76782/g.106637 Transcript_76782/m.106637 type:complete len:80 (+) Transcript_76782:172-411(+)